MAKPKQSGPSLLERIQVKGRDFDKDGKETPKEELLRMPGLFKLKGEASAKVRNLPCRCLKFSLAA